MTAHEYRQDDVLGQGYCPRCHRTITIDTALHGVCTVHGKVPADFTRPTGWADPDTREEQKT